MLYIDGMLTKYEKAMCMCVCVYVSGHECVCVGHAAAAVGDLFRNVWRSQSAVKTPWGEDQNQ